MRKPCPLCREEMTALETHAGRGELYCGNCDLTIGGNEAKTPDELMRILGRGECEMDVLDTGNEAAYEHYEYIMHCKSCHQEFGYVQYNEDGDTWQDEKPAFCPKCGKAVKR